MLQEPPKGRSKLFELCRDHVGWNQIAIISEGSTNSEKVGPVSQRPMMFSRFRMLEVSGGPLISFGLLCPHSELLSHPLRVALAPQQLGITQNFRDVQAGRKAAHWKASLSGLKLSDLLVHDLGPWSFPAPFRAWDCGSTADPPCPTVHPHPRCHPALRSLHPSKSHGPRTSRFNVPHCVYLSL